MRLLRAATAEQARALWPAVRAARLFATVDEFMEFRVAEPWRVRVTEQGEGIVLGTWRRHLEVLAIRGLWASRGRVPSLVREARSVAADHGFTSILSPLVTTDALEPYQSCGFSVAENLVVLQGLVDDVVIAGGRHTGVTVRDAARDDIPALVAIDAWCFDTFWGYREPEVLDALASENVVVACGDSGEALGYATFSDHGGTVTVGRLAVMPSARRRGVGTSLLRHCAQCAVHGQALAISLCTQEHNTASRALYSAMGMRELDERYALAGSDTGRRSLTLRS